MMHIFTEVYRKSIVNGWAWVWGALASPYIAVSSLRQSSNKTAEQWPTKSTKINAAYSIQFHRTPLLNSGAGPPRKELPTIPTVHKWTEPSVGQFFASTIDPDAEHNIKSTTSATEVVPTTDMGAQASYNTISVSLPDDNPVSDTWSLASKGLQDVFLILYKLHEEIRLQIKQYMLVPLKSYPATLPISKESHEEAFRFYASIASNHTFTDKYGNIYRQKV
ncbi:hypothetical protein BJ878DRAFT_216347 [Calycina marina]|uniref:Uncharacterized protein n=1 Tax=Calycina marina TaxID=1763456 RepID=A0A9P8CCH4_9HELO|nr:hypothetical protein BJ878DRAFT_216347 [Calycina marina]